MALLLVIAPWAIAAEAGFGDFAETEIYEIGEIPFQKVWHGDTLKFRVRSAVLGASAIISATYVQPPSGEIYFGNNGEFGYRPGTNDLTEFTVTFWAHLREQTLTQTIPVSPLARLPQEQGYFGVERGSIPRADSKDYLIFTNVLSQLPEIFNYFTNQTRRAVVAGKTVVLQAGHPNGLYEALHEQWSLRHLEIHAETLIIASPIRVPGTDVAIRARELEFQDFAEPSYLSTEPRWLAERPAQFADGVEGLPAGNLSLFIQNFKTPPDQGDRIRLMGGDGQPGGEGRGGTRGASKPTFSRTSRYVQKVASNRRGNVTMVRIAGLVLTYRNPSGTVRSDYDWTPGNGTDARAGGRPGSGGLGGTLTANTEAVGSASMVFGGQYGLGSTNSGGPPGTPVTAYYYRIKSNFDVIESFSHTTRAGRDATSPPPLQTNRLDGAVNYVDQPFAWLSPLALRQVIAHARQAYLNGQVEFVETAFGSYLEALEAFRATPQWDDLPAGWALDFAQMEDEMRLILHRIASNLDYFGNPPGWVPLLSFEANRAAFEQDLDTSIRVLYLEYWLGNLASNLTQRIAGQTAVRDLQKKALEQARRNYNTATELLPVIQTRSRNLQVRITQLQEEIKIIDENLQRRARDIVEDRHKGPFWRRALGTIGRICAVFPVGQPIVGAIGVGLVLASKFDPKDPFSTLEKMPAVAAQFNDAAWNQSVSNTKAVLDTLPIPDLDKGSIQDIVKDFQTQLQPWKEQYVKLQQATRQASAPKNEVEAELQKLRREHPELNDIIRKVESLNAEKEVLLQQIAQTTQRLGRLNSEIQFAMLAIDALNQDISQGLFAFDERAVSYLHEMGRRARERLLLYHYYLKKAYEYRLLQPYSPPDLDLDSLFTKLRQLAETGEDALLDKEKFDSIAVIYHDRLKNITKEVVNFYNANAPERSAPQFYELTAEQLEVLNSTNGPLTLNFKELGIFPPYEENHRIVNIEVESLKTLVQGNVGTGSIDLFVEHSGESIVNRRGVDYRFRHYRRDTEQTLQWGARYTPSLNHLAPIAPSDSAESLLRSLLGPGASSESILLWSRPGAWADFHLHRKVYVPPPSNGDIQIERLMLRITYDYFLRQDNVAVLEIADESQAGPLVQLSKSDQAGRQHGRGSFRRAYVTGESVAVQFPERLGNLKLTGLQGPAGQPLPAVASGGLVELNLTMAQDVIVRTHYEPVAPSARFTAFTPPTEGHPAATASIEGEYFAPYRIEFTPSLTGNEWSSVTNVLFVSPEALTLPAPLEEGFFRIVPHLAE